MAKVLVNAPSHQTAEMAMATELDLRGIAYSDLLVYVYGSDKPNYEVGLVVTERLNGVVQPNHTYLAEVVRDYGTVTFEEVTK